MTYIVRIHSPGSHPQTVYNGKSKRTADTVRQAIIAAGTLAGATVDCTPFGTFLPHGEPTRTIRAETTEIDL